MRAILFEYLNIRAHQCSRDYVPPAESTLLFKSTVFGLLRGSELLLMDIVCRRWSTLVSITEYLMQMCEHNVSFNPNLCRNVCWWWEPNTVWVHIFTMFKINCLAMLALFSYLNWAWMFYLCDINMISYLTIFTGQVIQQFRADNMITFVFQI